MYSYNNTNVVVKLQKLIYQNLTSVDFSLDLICKDVESLSSSHVIFELTG